MKPLYRAYENNNFEPSHTIKIEKTVFCVTDTARDIAPLLISLPLEEVQRMQQEAEAAEQSIFEQMEVLAEDWVEKAQHNLQLKRALAYLEAPVPDHTNNQWTEDEYGTHERSNLTYKMWYRIWGDTRLLWEICTNPPEYAALYPKRIAGQEKTFKNTEELDKYLAGRIKAYDKLFTELQPPVPKAYERCFMVNGVLLPGYTIEEE